MEHYPGLLEDDPADKALAAAVHPADWVNPAPAGRYDLVVVGGGTAGLVCAAGAAGLGARVALVERHLLGGDCLNDGCVPSKALLRSARAVYDARHGADFGVRGGEGTCGDFPAAMTRMRQLRSTLSGNDAALRFREELRVDVFFGQAAFAGSDCVEAAGQRLFFHRAAICTGAHPALPPIPGLAEAGCLTNETVFTLTQPPPRLAVIGAGPIGCELAQAFARFGSRVTLLDQTPRLLCREDPDAAAILQVAFEREGIDLRLGVAVESVSWQGDERLVRFLQDGVPVEVAVDCLLVGVGRAPNVEGLGLERAGIAWDRHGITVDDRLRTANRRVYAAGDCCSHLKFTHTADAQARLLLANALFGGRQKNSALTVPWCTYTDPEVAHVGLSAQEAQARGSAVTTLTVPLAQVDRAVLDGETDGFARVHLRAGSDEILGATIVARHAGEMIGGLALAMTNKLGMAAISRTILPYPTQADAVKKLADAWNRTRLTPGVKKLLKRWLEWQRDWT